MYLRDVHSEKDLPTLNQFIQDNPLGLLTTALESSTFPFLQTSHIPWILDLPTSTAETPNFGTLRGHIARANPQAKAFIEAAKAAESSADGTYTLPRDVLVLFNGPADHYVTPKFYTATKPATGKVVPTWNYAAVQVYGRARIFHDAKTESTRAFLDRQIRDLTSHGEVNVMGHGEGAWAVEDAPESYVEVLKKAIVGVEIVIGEIGGKWKMSQEMSVGDQEGVAEGFEGLGTEVGREMAGMVRERGKMREAGRS